MYKVVFISDVRQSVSVIRARVHVYVHLSLDSFPIQTSAED